MADSSFVITATADNFAEAVIQASQRVPVLVDFWADWCAPCKALMPLLAKLAAEYGGKFLLAKVNTEEEQELAVHFGIRSLPTVQLFKDGQPIDQFMGALPEGQVREFLDRHIGRESDALLARAQELMQSGALDEAERLIEQARTNDPDNARLHVAVARLKAAGGDPAAAAQMLERVPPELHHDPEVVALRGQMAFANLLSDAPPAHELETRLERDPRDSEARHRLAARLVANGDYEAGLEHLFQLMKSDRAYGEDAGRKGMLMVFDMLGNEGELVMRYRSRMMAALY